MRDQLRGYYEPTQTEFDALWREGLFILDANVLLALYEIDEKSRGEFAAWLSGLATQGRIWVPHQAAREFLGGRIRVIEKQIEMCTARVNKDLKPLRATLQKDLGSFRNPSPSPELLCRCIEAVQVLIKDLDGERSRLKGLLTTDPIRDEMSTILNGHVGPPYGKQETDDQIAEAKRRFGLRIPPGLEDAGKPNPYGDVLLWFQVIAQANDCKRPVVLVTDDRKRDWWQSADGDRAFAPRPELVQEMWDEAGVPFWAYTLEKFVGELKRRSPEVLSDTTVSQVEAIEEAKGILDDDASNRWHLQRFFHARGPAKRMTVWQRYSDDNTEYRWPPQDIPGEVETVEQLETILQVATKEWRSAPTCYSDDLEMPGEVDLPPFVVPLLMLVLSVFSALIVVVRRSCYTPCCRPGG